MTLRENLPIPPMAKVNVLPNRCIQCIAAAQKRLPAECNLGPEDT